MKLIIRLGAEEQTVEPAGDRITIGRSADCVVPVKHKSLSRLHCEIRKEGDGWVVKDCGSLNGTVVNGKKTAEHRLAPGDRIDVGVAHVFFEQLPERPRSKTPPPQKAPREEPAGEAEEPVVVPEEAGDRPVSYAAWSRGGFRGGGWAAGLAVAAGVLAGGYWGLVRLLGSGGPRPDVDNLLTVNPSFEAAASEGLPPGWVIPVATQSQIWIQRGDARDGRNCLVVEKVAAADEFLLGCAAETPIDLQPGAVYDVSGWIRAQGLKGGATLRCTARTEPAGLIVSQVYGERVEGTTDWTEVRFPFTAPRGAKSGVVECVAAGPEGRAQFDGLRVVRRGGETGADGATAHDFRNFRVLLRPGGVFHLLRKQGEGREKWVLASVRLLLRTPDGVMDQGFGAGRPEAPPPKAEGIGGALTVRTHILHPGTLQWVPVKQTLAEVEGEFMAVYELAGDGVRPGDEIGVETAGRLADAEATARIETETGESEADFADLSGDAVRRFLWRDAEAVYIAHYPLAPVRLSGGRRAGILRLEQVAEPARLEGGGGGPAAAAFALGVTVTLQRELGSLVEEIGRVGQLEEEGRYAEALEICQRVMDAARAKNEVSMVSAAAGRQRDLAARIERELAAARRVAGAARLIGAPDAVEAAERELGKLDRRLAGTRYAEDVRALRASLDASRGAAAADPARDPGGLAYRLAEFHLSRGDRALGRALLDHLTTHHKESPWAQEAEKLREKLGEGDASKGGQGGS